MSRIPSIVIIIGLGWIAPIAWAQEGDPSGRRRGAGESAESDPAVQLWVDFLAQRIGDENETIRRSAAQALAAVGEPALPALHRLADSGDERTAQAAKRIAARIEKAAGRPAGRPGGEKLGGEPAGPGRQEAPGQGVRERIAGAIEQLGLGDAETEKIRAILKEHFQKIRALADELRSGEIDREGLRAARDDLRAALRASLEGILTPEQVQKIERAIEEIRRGAEGKGARGGPRGRPGDGERPGPPPPPEGPDGEGRRI